MAAELGPYHTFALLDAEERRHLKKTSYQGYLGYMAFAAAEAVRLQYENVELRDETRLDHLTKELELGILNQKTMDEELVRHAAGIYQHTRRAGDPNSIIIVYSDADKFKKRVNSKYGQAEGNMAIKELAKAHAAAVRHEDDLVGRDGGDEFVLALFAHEDGNGSAERIAELVIERDKQNCIVLGEERIARGGLPYILTNTYGVFIWRPEQDISILEAKQLANQIMMENKPKDE